MNNNYDGFNESIDGELSRIKMKIDNRNDNTMTPGISSRQGSTVCLVL